MRTILRSLVLAPVVMAAVALATNSAMAATTLNVPFSFTAEGKTCPAGPYSVQLDSNQHFLTLSSKKAPVGFQLTVGPGDGARKSSAVTLRFDHEKQGYTLESVQFGPLTTSRLNKLAAHSEHQPVTIVVGQ